MAEPLIFVESESWARTNNSRELYAYDSLVADPNEPSSLFFYYTYLFPGGTFKERYFVRRRVQIDKQSMAFRASRVVLRLSRGPARVDGRGGDWWATTAVIPQADNYTRVCPVGTLLVTGGPGRKRLTDCYITQWDDHFIADEGDHCGTGTIC